MATDTEQLILSISADTAQIKRALARLPQDAKTAAQGVEQAFTRTDPVGRMQQNVSRSMRAVQNDTRNLTFQLNDITTQLLSGTSPFQVMVQQSSQVSQVLTGAGGISNALKSLGGAFLGLLNPISLATSAVIFGLGVAVQYFTTTKEEAKETKKALDDYKKTIEDLTKAFQTTGQDIDTVIDQLETYAKAAAAAAIANTQLTEKTEELRKLFVAGGRAKSAFAGDVESIEAMGEAIKKIDENKLDEAAGILAKLSIDKTLAPDTAAVVNQLLALAVEAVKAGDAWDKLSTSMSHAAEQFKFFQGMPLPSIGPPVTTGAGVFMPSQTQLEIAAGTADVELTRAVLKSKAANKAIADSLDNLTDEAVRAFGKLFQLLPETARITSGVRTRAEQARLYADYKAGRGGLAAPPGRSRHEIGAALDIGQGVDMATLKAAVGQVKELETLKGRAYEVDKVHVQLKGISAKVDEDAAEAAATLAEQQSKALVDLEKMITTEQQEIALKEKINAINADVTATENERALAIALVTAEAAKEAEVEKLVNQAKEAGLAITPELLAQYNALAQAKVNAILTDEKLAITQRDAAKATKEQQDAIRQFNQQMQQIATGAITGLISDLRNGVDAGEAFNNMLNRILDSLIQIGIQMAVKSLFGGFGFGGGGGGGGLFHGGGTVGLSRHMDGRKFPAALWAGAPRFASGGMVGLRAGEVPIIAHHGEIVVPNARQLVSSGRQPPQQVNTSLGDVNIDMSQTGYVAADNDAAKQFGQNVQKIVQMEMVRESRPGGLLRRVPG